MKSESSNRSGRRTFVIAHGAWVGAWAWVRVADVLTAHGHRVHVPTLSGLGERSHLAGAGINLTTHVNDVVNEILWKDLDRVVLVGHSYGGLVITGVAERVCDRIASIVYVDAFIPAHGQSFADFAPGADFSPTLLPPPPTTPGDYFSEADRAWVDAKATPQPSSTFTETLRVTGAYQRVPKKTFISATGWNGRLAADPSWTVHKIDCGHDVPIDRPRELATLLEACA